MCELSLFVKVFTVDETAFKAAPIEGGNVSVDGVIRFYFVTIHFSNSS